MPFVDVFACLRSQRRMLGTSGSPGLCCSVLRETSPRAEENATAARTGLARDQRLRYSRSQIQTVDIAGQPLQGVSVGAAETCIISSLLAFDIGRCPAQAVRMRIVAFTHMHVDHIGGVAFHVATRNMQKMAPPVYIVPASVAASFKELIHAFERVDGARYDFSVVPLEPGQEYFIKKGWVLRPFATIHTVPSQGYVLYDARKKLLEEYKNLSGPEISAHKRAGRKVHADVLIPHLAVTGDTTLDAIAACEDARKAKALVTEITFLDGTCTVDEARARGHVHIDELCQREHLFSENEEVLFTHFSARYNATKILEILKQKLSPALQAKSKPLLGEARIPNF